MTEPAATPGTGREAVERTGRVVVGIDGSPSSQSALRWAAEAASLRHASLRVVFAHVPAVEGDLLPEDAHQAASRQALDAARAEVARLTPDVAVDVMQLDRWAPEALVTQSRDADLVVLGSRGHGEFASLLIGSTSLQVAMHAACPVVVVRPGLETAASTAAPAPVVVGVDGSPNSADAIVFAAREASLRKVPLVAVHTWSLQYLDTPFVYEPMVRDWEQVEKDERQVLSDAVAGARQAFPDVDLTERLRRAHPVEELVKSSEEACLVVVGTRGRGGLAGLVLGSVSHGLLHHAHCPVAVVRPIRASTK